MPHSNLAALLCSGQLLSNKLLPLLLPDGISDHLRAEPWMQQLWLITVGVSWTMLSLLMKLETTSISEGSITCGLCWLIKQPVSQVVCSSCLAAH